MTERGCFNPASTRKMAELKPTMERITAAKMLHLCGEDTLGTCAAGQNEFSFKVTAWNLQPDEFGGTTLDIVSVDHPSNYEIVMIDMQGERILSDDLYRKFKAGLELNLVFNVSDQNMCCCINGSVATCCDFSRHAAGTVSSPVPPSQGVGALGPRSLRST